MDNGPPENAVQWSFMISASEATLKNMDKLSSGNSCYDCENKALQNLCEYLMGSTLLRSYRWLQERPALQFSQI